MKIQSALAMTMAFGLVGAACNTSSTPPLGAAGSSSSGGAMGAAGSASASAGSPASGGSNGQGACTNVAACGGSIVGTYTVTAPCLKVDGKLDISKASLDPQVT